MRKFLKNQKGITMIEVLVTVGLLAIVIVPCLSAFVMAQRGNEKASQVYAEYTEAQNLMETLKGIQVSEEENGVTDWQNAVKTTVNEAQSDAILIGDPQPVTKDEKFQYYIIKIYSRRDNSLVLEGVIAP